MTPERWRRIEKVYQAARDRDPSQRGVYIEETCGTDPDLRKEVESLLHQDDSTPEMPLNRPAWLAFGGTEDTVAKPAPGTRLGPYEIESALGAGGMAQAVERICQDATEAVLAGHNILGHHFCRGASHRRHDPPAQRRSRRARNLCIRRRNRDRRHEIWR